MSTVGPWRPGSGPSKRKRRAARIDWPLGPLGRGQPPSSKNTLESPAVRERLSSRLRIAEGVAIALVVGLLFGFWRLQVVHASHYRELAENNRRRNVVVRAPRGLLLDRNGNLLAANRAAFNVEIVREELDNREATLQWLAEVLGQRTDELEGRLQRRPAPAFRPVVVADDIDPSVVPAIEARGREFPGVHIRPEHKRYYPWDELAAHVLGHVGEINQQQLDSWGRDRYRRGDIVGKIGIERVHNDALSGAAGEEQLVVNSVGRTVQVFNQTPPRPGNTLTLTLDLEVQRRAESLLEGKKGAVVVLDVRDGGVLALASAPNFDPNMFARRFSTGEWDGLVSDPANPLQNRALTSAYPPGSTFKLLMAIAGLEAGVITPDSTVFCAGGGTFFGQYRRCHLAGGHGTVNLREAIRRSCNVYFYQVGHDLGRERIVDIAERFGLGARTGIDLLNEGSGTLPTDEWLANSPSRPDGRWNPGETISLAIGQGPIDTTPLQLAHMAATLATGVDIRPHLVRSEEDAAGRHIPTAAQIPRREILVNPYHRELVLDGMRAVVNENGSGWRAKLPGVAVGGKTGTSQVASSSLAGPEQDRPEELRNHAWFVGVAPVDAPEVAIAVFIEHGGGGGATAAPIAREVLAAYFGERMAAR